jgi:RHS repeat-associated protein
VRGQITQQTKSYPQQGGSSKTTQYTYFEDATQPNYGLLASYIGPRFIAGQLDDHIWYSYDAYGNLNDDSPLINGAVNGVRYRNYNSAGLPTIATYSDGTVDTMLYDNGYRLLTKTHGNNAQSLTTSSTYDALERTLTTTDADGKVTNYAYDAIGRLAKTTYPNGTSEQDLYHPNGVLYEKAQVSAAGTTVATNWQDIDGSGRVIYTRSGSSNALWTSITYDVNGNVTMTQTPTMVNTWDYDALNRVTWHKDGNGNADTKGYDNVGNNTSERAATNVGSGRVFVSHNLLSIENNDDFGRKLYWYDLSDNLGAMSHVFRTCNYGLIDQAGRSPQAYCTAISGSPAPGLLMNDQYTYDKSAYGNLDQVVTNTSNGVSTYYTYDLFHRVTRKTQANKTISTWGYAANQQSVNYSYTGNGSLTHMTYPSGNLVDYSYDNNGVLNNIKLNNQPLINNIAFDGANRLNGFNWGQGGSWQQTQGEDNLIQQVSSSGSGGNVFLETYQYDLDGRIKSKLLNNSSTFTYGYDNNSQLKSEGVSGSYSVNYNYDNNGNRTLLNSSGSSGYDASTVNYTYPWANHLGNWTKNGVGQPVGFGGTGILVSTYKGSADYDYANRRRQESAVPGSTQYTGQYFDYNHKNERTFRGGSSIDRQYVYDESSHLIGEYGLTGTMIVEYVWLGDRPIAAIYAGNRIVYLVTDNQNKPRRGIDASTQQVVWQWDPDAFGVKQPIGSVTINLRFPGQYYDQQSGLYYNHNRYYNPELGRYMEPDPIGLDGGLNPYSYAGNNPVNNVDPSGLSMIGMDDFSLGNSFLGFNNFNEMNLQAASNQFLNSQSNFNLQANFAITAGRSGAIAGAELGVWVGGPWGAAVGGVIGGVSGAYAGYKIDQGLNAIFNKPPVPDAVPHPETPVTGSGTRQWEKPNAGGFDTAVEDFKGLNPTGVNPMGGRNAGGFYGTLPEPDGRPVNVRPTSSEGRPTLEIQRPGGKRSDDKIRY